MFAVAGALMYLAIAKEYEPSLLLPIGFGTLLGNLPNSPLNHPGGMLYILNEFGIQTELFPLFIFIGIGALMDFPAAALAADLCADGRRRAAGHLRDADPGDGARLSAEPGGVDRHHRRD